MAEEAQSDMSPDAQKRLVRVLMAGLRYPELLEGFERDFVSSLASSYRRFSRKTRITDKQQAILDKLGAKLCLT